jgi:hypothetical protein
MRCAVQLSRWQRFSLIVFCVIIVVGSIKFYTLALRAAALRTDSANLKDIAVAIYDHLTEHDEMPANICGKDGQPLLSWRVALLPALGLEELYAQFRLDEPWDSLHNRQLLNQMPNVFRTSGLRDTHHTHIQAMLGAGTAFARPALSKNALKNSMHKITISVTANSVCWAQPTDVVINEKTEPDGLFKIYLGGSILSTHQRGFHLFANLSESVELRRNEDLHELMISMSSVQ